MVRRHIWVRRTEIIAMGSAVKGNAIVMTRMMIVVGELMRAAAMVIAIGGRRRHAVRDAMGVMMTWLFRCGAFSPLR
jgi:hypothetical protein